MSQRQESQPLDEDLCNKITYHPECQATFRAYKKILRSTILMITLIVLVMLLIAAKFVRKFIMVDDSIVEVDKIGYFMLFLLALTTSSIVLYMTYRLILSIRDLLASKLNIVEDVMLKITPSDKNSCAIEFKKSGTLHGASSFLNKEIRPYTTVYVIRTIHAKTLLDIIPIENTNIAP